MQRLVKMRGSVTIFTKRIIVIMLLVFLLSSPVSAEFKDTEHWAKHYIEAANSRGWMVGVNSTEFRPNDPVTRGQFITIVSRYAKADLSGYSILPFKDVAKYTYYTKPILWGYDNGYIQGTGNGKFSPENPISRQDVCKVLSGYLNLETVEPNYKDNGSIADYAYYSVGSMQSKGYMVGSGGYFHPRASMTRAECAVVFCRLQGLSYPIYEVPKPKPVEPQENRVLLGTYKMTCYCPGCNSPRGSRQTASGATATAGSYGTVAVSSSTYSKLGKNAVIYIEGIGYRKIQDKHGRGSSIIDIFVDTSSCRCSSNAWSNTYHKVYLVK